jgi:hypothetical protein
VGEASGLDVRGWKPLPQISGNSIEYPASREAPIEYLLLRKYD